MIAQQEDLEELFELLDLTEKFQTHIEPLRVDLFKGDSSLTGVSLWLSLTGGADFMLPNDVIDLMSKHTSPTTPTKQLGSIDIMFRQYSSQGNLRMSFQDFQEIVMPRQEQSLLGELRIRQREVYAVKMMQLHHKSIEYMQKILSATMDYCQTLEQMKQKIGNISGFSLEALKEFMFNQDRSYGGERVERVIRNFLRGSHKQKSKAEIARQFYTFLTPLSKQNTANTAFISRAQHKLPAQQYSLAYFRTVGSQIKDGRTYSYL